MYKLTMDGEPMAFGMDDVVDFLSQYGRVLRLAEIGWLHEDPAFTQEFYAWFNRLHFFVAGDIWVFFALRKGQHTSGPGTNDLVAALKQYLEITNQHHPAKAGGL